MGKAGGFLRLDGKIHKKNPWTPPQENIHAKPNGAATLGTEELSLLWEEIQKCAGHETVEEYYALGQRQSELADTRFRSFSFYLDPFGLRKGVSPVSKPWCISFETA